MSSKYFKAALTAILTIAVFTQIIAAVPDQSTSITLVQGNRPLATIVYTKDIPLYALTANRLTGYIEKQSDIKLPFTTENVKPSAKNATILFDGSKDKNLLKKFGLSAELKSERADAYIIKTLWHNQMPFVILAGNSPDAVKFAAYRLMEQLDVKDKNVSVKLMNIKVEPFFKTRVIAMGNIWRNPLEIQRKYNIEAWPVEKINRSVNMYDSFGFNAFEMLDRFNDGYLVPCYGITREEWRNKIWAMADNAHLNGQKIFLRAWGNAVMDIPNAFKTGATAIVPRIFKTFCPDLPEDRKRWENEIRDYYVPNYAKHIDNFIGHWADAGGCRDPQSKATVKDAMLLHMELENAFKKINPKIETSFSFWQMNSKNWREYKDHRSVSNGGVLDKDVILAQVTRSKTHPYSEKISEDFIADGHRPAVWTWIRADAESFHNDASMLIRVHSLGEYFSNLPNSAKSLEWHNLERCQHGLGNVVNFYVAGKLMWDPKANVDKLLQDFSTKMFGQKNSPHIVEAYNVMEDVRKSDNGPIKPTPKNPEQVALQCQNALVALEKVKIDPNYRPRLEIDITPDQIKNDLVGALTVIRDYSLCFGNELTKLDTAIKQKNKQEEEKLLTTLKNNINVWGSSIAGLFEARAMEQELQRRGYEIGTKL